MTDFVDGNIDVAIVKEFYANLYDPEDKSPKEVMRTRQGIRARNL